MATQGTAAANVFHQNTPLLHITKKCCLSLSSSAADSQSIAVVGLLWNMMKLCSVAQRCHISDARQPADTVAVLLGAEALGSILIDSSAPERGFHTHRNTFCFDVHWLHWQPRICLHATVAAFLDRPSSEQDHSRTTSHSPCPPGVSDFQFVLFCF